MFRTAVIATITLSSTFVLADKAKTVTATKASAPVLIKSADEGYEGCGLAQIPLANSKGSRERGHEYNGNALKKAHRGYDIKGVWTWCVKPDLSMRVWSACTGAGDSTDCHLYAAPIDAKGALGKVAKLQLGWAPPTVKDIDSNDAPLWVGKGLRIEFETGRANAVVGMYLDKKGAVKFTKPEWDES